MEWASFHHYTVKDGLSCNYVHSISQDKNGFLWVATEYGLNKFDGVHFKNYFFEDYPSLFRNDIIRSVTLEDGTVCFGSNNGMAVSYDELTDSFHNLAPKDFDSTYYKCVTGIYPISGGRTILSTNAGLYLLDKENGRFDKNPIAYQATQDIFTCSLLEDDWGRIWIGSFPGVRVWDKDFKRCGPTFLSEINEMVSSMVRLDHNRILISSSIGSLGVVHIGDDGVILRAEKIETPFKCITAILKDSKGRIWLGTSGSGLWRGECRSGKWSFERQAPININVDELKKVHTLFEDRDGDIWIGTQNSGLWRYGESKESSSLHSSDIGFPLVDGTSFAEDGRGNIVVSADGHGCYLLSPDLKLLKHIQTEDGLTSNNVLSLQKGVDGKIWVASWGGVPCTYDTETGKITQYPFNGIGFAYSTSKVLHCFQNGEVGVGLAGDGIYCYSKEKNIWNHVRLIGDSTISSEDRWVEHLMETKQGVRWIVTSRTVWRWENGKMKAAYPDIDATQSHNPLMMFQGACDEAGNLFVVSNRGVLRFEADGSSFKSLDFLPTGHYSSILMGRDGHFWTSGSNGILYFDYDGATYHQVLLDDRCRNRNYFTSRAAFQDSKGRFYFGSTEGFMVFDPTLKRESSGVSYLSFSDLYLFGERVLPSSDLLPAPLSRTNELVLNYDETNISISFDVLDFSGLNIVDASYRINGLDRRWVDLGDKREVKISHLPFGDYVLEVKALRRDGVGDPKIITLNIRVLPPWWKTWWCTLLMVLGLVAIVAGVLYYRFRSIVKQRELLSKMVAERTKELDESNQLLGQKQKFIEQRNQELLDVLREKDRLISVVAHDLKNPMFAIVGALEGVVKRREISPNTWKVLNDTYLSAFNLQSVMVKLLEWARGKQSDVACRMDHVSLHQIMTEVLDLLNGVLSEKNITVDYTSDVKHKVFADGRMIGTAIRNVLSNAVKFTPMGGSIRIYASEELSVVRLSITDSGVGMTKEKVEELMGDGRHESTLGTNNEKGTGLGFQMTKDFVRKSGGAIQLESEEGKGTTIVISLTKSDELAEISAPAKASSETFEVNAELLDGNTVMVVDDDPLILNNLCEMLKPYVNVVSASNGEEGLRVVKESRPDIIISDVEMPVVDGIEMYKRLRSEQPTMNVPLVFLSARSDEDDRLRGLSSGAIDYVTKPFSAKELLMKLHNILQWRRTQQQQVLTRNFEEDRIDEEANDLLRGVLQVVEKRYQDSEFSIDDIADELAMSKSSLSRKLKSITDKTPLEIITEFRLHRAQKMLREGRSVSDVAYSVGFNDPLYFSRKYRAEFGYPPSQES